MAGAAYAQNSFLGGEVCKNVQGRFDTREYRTYMNVCLNGFPTETGSWTRRPGFAHLGLTRRATNARVIPFAVSGAQPITMELSDLFLRFWNGTQLVMTNDGVFVTNISTANPAVVTVSSAVNWTSANQVQFELPGTLCPSLQNRQPLITRIDSTHFSLQDDITGFNIDGSTLGWVAPATPVGVTRVQSVGTLYLSGTANSWANIRSVQTETTAVLLNGNLVTRVDVTATPNAFPLFTWTEAQFFDGPYLDPDGSTMTPNATSGTITLICSGFVNNGAGFTSADVGRMIRLFSEPVPWPGPGTGVGGNIVTFGGGYWIQQTDATTTPPGSIGSFAQPYLGEQDAALAALGVNFSQTATTSTPAWLPLTVAAAARWVWGTIASVVNSSTVTVASLQEGGGNSGETTLIAVTPINTWRLGAYGGPNGYPTCGVYHEGRLGLMGAIDNRFDASNSNNIFNFAPTLVDGTVLDSSAIDVTFNSVGVNPILWGVSDQQGIICGTQAAEWLIAPGVAGGILTPSSISARPITANGMAFIQPARTEHTIVAVHKFERKLLEYFPDVFSGRYTAPDLSANWKHLTQPYIKELTYQQELVPTVWMRMGDGTLKGMTYRRDNLMSSQGPSFNAGHRHVLGSGWSVQSIATGSNTAGTLDALTMVTYEAGKNFYHVEQLTDMFQEGTAKPLAWFVDAGIRPSSQRLTSVNNVPVFQLNGLFHLNGYTVSAFIGGLDAGDWPVANGTMNIPLQGDPLGLLTSQFINNGFATGGLAILVGFTYTSQGQLVRPATAQESGARNGPALGKVRRSHKAAVLFQDTFGVSLGTDFVNANAPCVFKSAGGSVNLTPFQSYSGVYKTTLKDIGTSFDSMLSWQITRPQPCTVVAYEGMLETQDE